jgi:hypothetical protein
MEGKPNARGVLASEANTMLLMGGNQQIVSFNKIEDFSCVIDNLSRPLEQNHPFRFVLVIPLI